MIVTLEGVSPVSSMTISAILAMSVSFSPLGSGLSSDVTATANRKALTKGVRLWVEEEKVTVELSILVRYGYVVTDVARAVQDAVFSAVENTGRSPDSSRPPPPPRRRRR